MYVNVVTRYIADHWHGRHGLVRSIFVNLLAIRVAIILAQNLLAPAEGTDHAAHALLVIAAAIFAHGVVFVWQVVGVLRSAERHIRHKGSMSGMWAAQLCAVLAFWFAATDAFEAWQMTLPVPVEENFAERMDREHASRYSISGSGDGATLLISGKIEQGISRRVTRELEANPAIRRIVLESDGGNIYEARGLSRLIRDNGIDTRTESHCNSACTTVFIAGKRRSATASARLGFHQYRIDADYDVPNADPAAEQERDMALFTQSGIAPWFLARIFETEASGMWFPTMDELLASGVVHEIAP